MSRSDCKQIASDILSNDEVDNNNCGDEMKIGIFQDVKVYTGLMNVKNILLEKINATEKKHEKVYLYSEAFGSPDD